MSDAVRINRPESRPVDDDFVNRTEPGAFVPPAEPVRYAEDEAPYSPGADEDQRNAERLDKFLSAKPRDVEPETKELYVKSIGTTVIVRELTNREAEDVFEMFQDAMRPDARDRKRVLGVNSYLIAKAMMEPNFNNPIVVQKLQARFGEGLSIPDIILKIFKPGEIISLGDAIMTLSGTEEDAVTEAKN